MMLRTITVSIVLLISVRAYDEDRNPFGCVVCEMFALIVQNNMHLPLAAVEDIAMKECRQFGYFLPDCQTAVRAHGPYAYDSIHRGHGIGDACRPACNN